MCFDDAAPAFTIDDAHDDRPRAWSGEFGDNRDTEPADPESHGNEEVVELVGEVVIGCRCAEHFESGERMRV